MSIAFMDRWGAPSMADLTLGMPFRDTAPDRPMLTDRTQTRRVTITAPAAGLRFTFDEDAPPWVRPTLERMIQLLSLPPNWDSYGAPAVTPEIVKCAVEVLTDCMGAETPPPAVVPTSSGGIQLEWHRHGIDLEISLSAFSPACVALEDDRTGESWEGQLDWTTIRKVLARISAP